MVRITGAPIGFAEDEVCLARGAGLLSVTEQNIAQHGRQRQRPLARLGLGFDEVPTPEPLRFQARLISASHT